MKANRRYNVQIKQFEDLRILFSLDQMKELIDMMITLFEMGDEQSICYVRGIDRTGTAQECWMEWNEIPELGYSILYTIENADWEVSFEGTRLDW